MTLNKKETDFVDLAIRYLSGNTSADENKELSEWLHAKADNRLSFNAIRDVWLASSQIDPMTLTIASSVPVSHTSDLKSEKMQWLHGLRLNSMVKTALRIAAIFIATLFIGTISYKLIFEDRPISPGDHLTILEATMGSKAVATLPDGTKVWLNAGSKLSYKAGYDLKSRDVNLTGEAYFDVKHKPSKPFVVHAGSLSIKALGTSFNVKAYPDEQSIVTTLVKGKVVIEGKDKSRKAFTVNMKPNESVTYFKDADALIVKNLHLARKEINSQQTENESTENPVIENIPAIKLDQVNTALFTSWKDERWVIENQQLELLTRDFERRYDIKIELATNEIGGYHFTGTIQNETIEQIMVILRHTIPLKYTIDRGIVKISEDTSLVNEFKLKSPVK